MGGIKSSKDPYGIFEYHSLGIALANTLGFDTIAAYWLLLATLDPTLATC